MEPRRSVSCRLWMVSLTVRASSRWITHTHNWLFELKRSMAGSPSMEDRNWKYDTHTAALFDWRLIRETTIIVLSVWAALYSYANRWCCCLKGSGCVDRGLVKIYQFYQESGRTCSNCKIIQVSGIRLSKWFSARSVWVHSGAISWWTHAQNKTANYEKRREDV